MTSVFDIFQSRGATVWWDRRHLTQGFNNRNEKGQDFGLPLNTPIASISSGRVIYAQRMNSDPGSSVGYIVQVENADGSIFHYQHLRTSSVHVGDYVRVGQMLGLSGGCPANGYGSGGCTRTDQYTTGPHIEVRYSPTYDASRGAWGQNWIDPGSAFQSYGGSQISDLLPSGLGGMNGGLPGAAASVLSLPSNFGDVLAAGLGAGISRGLGQFAQDELHPVVDFTARGFLIGLGSVMVAVALFAIAMEGGREQVNEKLIKPAAPAAGGAIAGEAGAQVAKSVIPPVGDQKRARIYEQAHPKPALPALPSPSPQKSEQQIIDEGREKTRKRLEDIKAGAGVNENIAKVYGVSSEAKVREVDIPPAPPSGHAGTRLRQLVKGARSRAEQRERRERRNLRRRTKNTPEQPA